MKIESRVLSPIFGDHNIQSQGTMADHHWELSGKLSHLIYNPRGGIEGLLLDVDGIPAQFVSEPHLETTLARCKPGQRLTLIGELRKPSPKGPSDHEVYDLNEIVGEAFCSNAP